MRNNTQITLFIILLLLLFTPLVKSQQLDTTIILKFNMNEEVSPALWRKTQKAFDKADQVNANLIIINMNTYGGLVTSADSIRTKIMNSKIPVYVFINNNAASAGALISVACDKIYMRSGANIGAATVVNQTGAEMPDKYQSYMRSTMRATAESHGKDSANKWIRDPAIAEAMVDADVYVKGVSDTGKVITFTTNEAIKYGYCDGKVKSVEEIIEKEALNPVIVKEYKPSKLDKLIGILINPAFQGILIMAIFGGIYFELQSPGIGFPLGVAVLAAILYFAPLYIEGIAENWEIALFVLGVILIAVEIFAIPGFGVAGISGIILTILGLTLAMVDSFDLSPVNNGGLFLNLFFKSMLFVIASMGLALIGSLYLSKKLFSTSFFGNRIALHTQQITKDGYIGVDSSLSTLIGQSGSANTDLCPSGTIKINDELFDAKADFGFISKGENIKVIKYETSQLYVIKAEN